MLPKAYTVGDGEVKVSAVEANQRDLAAWERSKLLDDHYNSPLPWYKRLLGKKQQPSPFSPWRTLGDVLEDVKKSRTWNDEVFPKVAAGNKINKLDKAFDCLLYL